MACRSDAAALIFIFLTAGSVAAASAEDAPSQTQPEQPIRSSIDRIAKEMQEERDAPCRKALEEGKPCFGALVEARAPEYSVKASLENFVAEERRRRQPRPSGSGVAIISFDPVCVGKSAVKAIKGKNDTYYLYWMRDQSGERPSLWEHPVDPATHPIAAGVSYELIAKFDGECEAIAAFRRAEREGRKAAQK